MVGEGEVRERFYASTQDLRRLDAEIIQLRYRVKLGGDDWRATLEHLRAREAHRRTLQAQLQALAWVLRLDDPIGAREAEGAPSFRAAR